MTTCLPIDQIRTDGGTQSRAELDWHTVKDYVELMLADVEFPPVKVVYDGQAYWLWDGFHRIAAAKEAGIREFEAEVFQGTLEDAQWESFGANKDHGLRRSNEDKKRGVIGALKHPKGATLSDSQIAKHIGVDHKTVARWRTELESTWEIPKSTQRTGSDGRTINTTNIGKRARGPLLRYTGEQSEEAQKAAEWIAAKEVYDGYDKYVDVLIIDDPLDFKKRLMDTHDPDHVTMHLGIVHSGWMEDGVSYSKITPEPRRKRNQDAPALAPQLAEPLPNDGEDNDGDGEPLSPDLLARQNALAAKQAERYGAQVDDDALDKEDDSAPADFVDDWADALLPNKSYACDRQNKVVVDDSGDYPTISNKYPGLYYARGVDIIAMRGARRDWQEMQLVTPSEYALLAGPRRTLEGPLIGFRNDEYYPVERQAHTIYNDPHNYDAAYAKHPADYHGHQVAFIKGERINGNPRFNFWLIADPCRDQPTVPASKSQLTAAATTHHVTHSLLSLDSNMWYPVDQRAKVVYSDPFPTRKDGLADDRYPRVFCSFKMGCFIQDSVRNGGGYIGYKLEAPLPHEPLTHSNQPDNPESAAPIWAGSNTGPDTPRSQWESLHAASSVGSGNGNGHKTTALDALHSSESVEWYTPEKYVVAARAVLGSIDLDPASCEMANATVQAARYYTSEHDGLMQDWTARTVWLNPPYGRNGDFESNQAVWSARLIADFEAGIVEQALLLVSASTAQEWFQPLWAYPICFVTPRINFISPDGSKGGSNHGSVIVYFGREQEGLEAFTRHFSPFGRIVLPFTRYLGVHLHTGVEHGLVMSR